MITREIVKRGGILPSVVSKRERYHNLFISGIAININKSTYQ
jgi:hypothetical protein